MHERQCWSNPLRGSFNYYKYYKPNSKTQDRPARRKKSVPLQLHHSISNVLPWSYTTATPHTSMRYNIHRRRATRIPSSNHFPYPDDPQLVSIYPGSE